MKIATTITTNATRLLILLNIHSYTVKSKPPAASYLQEATNTHTALEPK